MYIHIHVYIYIYIERERDVYIYIYIYVCLPPDRSPSGPLAVRRSIAERSTVERQRHHDSSWFEPYIYIYIYMCIYIYIYILFR